MSHSLLIPLTRVWKWYVYSIVLLLSLYKLTWHITFRSNGFGLYMVQ